MAESRNDARDDLTVLMLADQHIGSCSTIPDRDHELLRMPKCKDDMLALTIQGVDLLVALRIHCHRPPQPSHDSRPDRRQHR